MFRTRISRSFTTNGYPNSNAQCSPRNHCNLAYNPNSGLQAVAFYQESNSEIVLGLRRWALHGPGDWSFVPTGVTNNNPFNGHNQLCLGWDGDDRILLTAGTHGGNLRVWRGTAANVVTLDSEMSLPLVPDNGTIEEGATYPHFFARGGDLYMPWRYGGSGNGTWQFYRWSSATDAFSSLGTIFVDTGSPSVSMYPHLMQLDSSGTWHVAFGWRNGSGDFTTNEGVFYVKSSDNWATAQTVDGTNVPIPITRANTLSIANCRASDVPQNSGYSNTQGFTLDSAGRPHIGFYQDPSDSPTPGVTQYWDVFWDGSAWQKRQTSSGLTVPWTLVGVADPAQIDVPYTVPVGVSHGNAVYWFRNTRSGGEGLFCDFSFAPYTTWNTVRLSQRVLSDWSPSFDTRLWTSQGVLETFCQRVIREGPISAQAGQSMRITLPTQMAVPLTVSITSPLGAAEFDEGDDIEVEGTVSRAGATVTVNGNVADVDGTAWSYTLEDVEAGALEIEVLASEGGDDASDSVDVVVNAAVDPLTISITSPPTGAYPEDETIAIVGTVSRAGATVTVSHGATNLGPANVVSTDWSLDWTPTDPIAAASLVAHASEGGDNADSAAVSIEITASSEPPSIFDDIPFRFWLRGDSVTLDAGGTEAAQLDDKIMGGGHTAVHFSQATETAQPSYAAAGGPNGTPIVTGDGSNDILISTWTPGQPATVPRWCWYVVRPNSPASNSGLSGCGGGTRQAIRWITTGPAWQLNVSTAPFTVPATNNTWGLLLVYISGSADDYLEWRGNRITPGTTAGNLAGVSPLRLFAYSGSGVGAFSVAEYGELIGAQPTSDQINEFKAYVTARYGAGLTTGG